MNSGAEDYSHNVRLEQLKLTTLQLILNLTRHWKISLSAVYLWFIIDFLQLLSFPFSQHVSPSFRWSQFGDLQVFLSNFGPSLFMEQFQNGHVELFVIVIVFLVLNWLLFAHVFYQLFENMHEEDSSGGDMNEMAALGGKNGGLPWSAAGSGSGEENATTANKADLLADSRWMTLFRFCLRFMTGIGYIPMFSALFGFGCTLLGISSSKWSSSAALTACGAVVWIIAALFFVYCTLWIAVDFEYSLSSDTLLARAHSRFDLVHHFVRTLLIVLFCLSDSHALLITVYILCMTFLAAVIYIALPYYHQHITALRVVMTWLLAWTSICAIVNDQQNQDNTAGALLFYVANPLVIVCAILMVRTRRQNIAVSELHQLWHSCEVELRARFFLQHLAAVQSDNPLLPGGGTRDDRGFGITKLQGGSISDVKLDPEDMKMLEEWYNDGARRFPQSPLVHMGFAIFLLHFKVVTTQPCLVHLGMAEELEPQLDQRMFIYQVRAIVEQQIRKKASHMLSYVAFQRHAFEARRCDVLATRYKVAFWQVLSSAKPDIGRLHGLGIELHHNLHKAMFHYQAALRLNSQSPQELRNYGSFLIQMMNDTEQGQLMLDRAEEIDNARSKVETSTFVGRVTKPLSAFDDRNAVIGINAWGELMHVNAGACRIWGYAENEMVHRNVTNFMPQPWSVNHPSFLSGFRQRGSCGLLGNRVTIFGLNKNGLIFPFMVEVHQITCPSTSMCFMSVIQEPQMKGHTLFVDHTTGKVNYWTAGCLEYFPALTERREQGVCMKDCIPGFIGYESKQDNPDAQNGTEVAEKKDNSPPPGEHIYTINLRHRGPFLVKVEVTPTPVREDMVDLIMVTPIGPKPRNGDNMTTANDMNNKMLPTIENNDNSYASSAMPAHGNDDDSVQSSTSTDSYERHANWVPESPRTGLMSVRSLQTSRQLPSNNAIAANNNTTTTVSNNNTNNTAFNQAKAVASVLMKETKEDAQMQELTSVTIQLQSHPPQPQQQVQRPPKQVHIAADDGQKARSERSYNTHASFKSQNVASFIKHTLMAKNGKDQDLRYLRTVMLVTLTLLTLVIIGNYIGARVLFTNYTDIVNHSRVVQHRQTLPYRMAYAVRTLSLVHQRQLSAKDEIEARAYLRDFVNSLTSIDDRVYISNHDLPPQEPELMESATIHIKELINNDVVTRVTNLHEYLTLLVSRGQYLLELDTSLTGVSNLHPYVFYFLNNFDGPAARVLNSSSHVWRTYANEKLDIVGWFQIGFTSVTIFGVVCVLFFVFRPAIFRVEQNKSLVMNLFLDVPRGHVMKARKDTMMRLETLTSTDVDGVGNDEDDEDVFARNQQIIDSTSDLSLAANAVVPADAEKKQAAASNRRRASVDATAAQKENEKGKSGGVPFMDDAADLPASVSNNGCCGVNGKVWIGIKILLILAISAGYFVGVLMWSKSLVTAHNTKATEIIYAGERDIGVVRLNHIVRDLVSYSFTNSTPQLQQHATVNDVVSWLRYVQKSLMYGSSYIDVDGVAKRYAPHEYLLLKDNCVSNGYVAVAANCSEYARRINQQGLVAAQEQYFQVASRVISQLADNRTSISSPITSGAMSLQSTNQSLHIDDLDFMHEMHTKYLTNGLRLSQYYYELEVTDSVTNFNDFVLVLVILVVAALVALYVFVYSRLLFQLQADSNRTRSALLLLPIQTIESVPTIRQFIKKHLVNL